MTQTLETTRPLTEEERQQVESFAEFLISRRAAALTGDGARPVYVDVDALAGMLAGMGGDKTSVELAHEATEIRAAKFERDR